METVTVVIPVHDEAATIAELFSAFDSIVRKAGYYPKFVVVNDASQDDTLSVILRLKEGFGYQIKVINLEFNVGQHPSLLIGTRSVTDSDYVVIADADMQNPPEHVIRMLELMKAEGYNIVYGLRRDSRLGNGLLSKIFWIGVYLISRFQIPRDQTPLKVIDAKFLYDFNRLETYSYAFFPYNLSKVKAKVGYFSVPTVPRKSGVSKYNLFNKLELYVKVCAAILLGYGRKLNYKIENTF
ncbi:MAG: glycosyltransferase [Patescibacteria group bacterium]